MTDPTSTPQPSPSQESSAQPLPGPIRCLSGATIAGGIAYALYSLTLSIGQTFAAKPIHSDNVTVINITAAVRTLVVGMSALGTGVFGLAALGLFALAIQVTIQRLTGPSTPPSVGD